MKRDKINDSFGARTAQYHVSFVPIRISVFFHPVTTASDSPTLARHLPFALNRLCRCSGSPARNHPADVISATICNKMPPYADNVDSMSIARAICCRQCLSARNAPWNPAGVKPIHWKPTDIHPGSLSSGTNRKVC